MVSYSIDEYGRAVVCSDGLFELWYQNTSQDGAVIIPDNSIALFNTECSSKGKDEYLIGQSPEPIPHEMRITQWNIPEKYKIIDVEDWCLSLCSSDEERARVGSEMALYRARGMEITLKAMIYMVDTFREKNIVWGIGRGSSVASFVLYLIGIHKINSIQFELDIKDFLR